jgi:hypothetical protein
MAHTSYMVDKEDARACTRTQICKSCCFSTPTMIRERTSLLSYAYIGCLVLGYIPEFSWKRRQIQKNP